MARPLRISPNLGLDEWLVAPMTDHAHEAARRFVTNLKVAMGTDSVLSTAKRAGVDRNSLRMVLEGHTWPDGRLVAKLEAAFERTLWPGYFKD
ncbi:helix-turn-helix domain-containing protein [Leifsonia sp. 2MCAF36]|uniref:helix-turn-helix domain-containing protein n=1 Tax=Leifsonia sp. 2MCAF36 TaxID=3232988 RepID=UPI003F97A294